MAKEENPPVQNEMVSVRRGRPTAEPSLFLSRGPQPLKLSEGQRDTILKYVELPAHLSDRLVAKSIEAKGLQFTLDELDELLDHVEESVYRAKGNERQKVLRIADKLSKLLGSTIDLDEMPRQRPPNKTATIYQIKMSLKGIDPPIWRRIQTKDCTLHQLHQLIQIAMGWEFDHPYCFEVGGVDFMDQEMIRDNEVWDASATRLSDILPVQNRRPRFHYEYDFGDQWMHQLILEERFAPEPGVTYPRCVAGARACPPEDCGGLWGYYRFLSAITDPPENAQEHPFEDMRGRFDPEKFDEEAVNTKLRRMVW